MKKAIITIFNNIQCVSNNHSGLESTYFANIHDCYYIGKKGRTNKNEPKYLDISEVDLSDFDKIIISLTSANFFGGVLSDDTIMKIDKLCDYRGKIAILCNDPRIKPINAAKVIYERFEKLSLEHVYKFEEILKNANYIFPGKSLNKFWNDDKYDNFIQYDYFKDIFKHKLSEPKYVYNDKKHDVVYYGDRRASYRENQIVNYLPELESSLLIGFKTKKINVPFLKKQKHSDLVNVLNECKVSLILGDKEHEGNVVTFRFYETLASNCLCAIPIEYDPNKELIEDEVLRELLYVKNKKDVIRLSGSYSKELIERQHNEYKRIMNYEKI